MLQLRNRVRTAASPLLVNFAVSVRTIPSVDDVTVAFHHVCLKVTATYAGRVDGSIPTTCGALPSVICFEKLYRRRRVCSEPHRRHRRGLRRHSANTHVS